MKKKIKDYWLTLFLKSLKSEYVDDYLSQYVNKDLQSRCNTKIRKVPNLKINSDFNRKVDECSNAPVFITARFRSGSTLFWNIFRHSENFESYYEPFNENKWFESSNIEDFKVDPTHLNILDYRSEYKGLGKLASYYSVDWVKRQIYMDEFSWNPEMKSYINAIIDHKNGKTPVLQFNRVDFRLPWLKKNFPQARIVHLYRNHRDIWISQLKDKGSTFRDVDFKSFKDGYYLKLWAKDLVHIFPFLDDSCLSHPYELSYLLWKLSLNFGYQFADYNVSYDDLMCQPIEELLKLETFLSLEKLELSKHSSLVEPSLKGARWQHFADEEWFFKKEEKCEEILSNFFS
jgi:hypothetical protein